MNDVRPRAERGVPAPPRGETSPGPRKQVLKRANQGGALVHLIANYKSSECPDLDWAAAFLERMMSDSPDARLIRKWSEGNAPAALRFPMPGNATGALEAWEHSLVMIAATLARFVPLTEWEKASERSRRRHLKAVRSAVNQLINALEQPVALPYPPALLLFGSGQIQSLAGMLRADVRTNFNGFLPEDALPTVTGLDHGLPHLLRELLKHVDDYAAAAHPACDDKEGRPRDLVVRDRKAGQGDADLRVFVREIASTLRSVFPKSKVSALRPVVAAIARLIVPARASNANVNDETVRRYLRT